MFSVYQPILNRCIGTDANTGHTEEMDFEKSVVVVIGPTSARLNYKPTQQSHGIGVCAQLFRDVLKVELFSHR